MKLESSIPSTSVKLIDLYNKISSGSLILGPDFQRKNSVWKKQHKYAFIETILLNFPFPEIYIASDKVDVESLRSFEVVVDGQQRLSTIVEYIQGKNDFQNQTKLKSFDNLSINEKKDFLNYVITVKDLKEIGEKNTKEVFKRINSTNYSLNQNEILNAQYGGGEFAIFCKQLADSDYIVSENETDIIIEVKKRNFINNFFKRNNVFSDSDVKRMFDSNYIMLITSTILEGKYFGRSTRINHYLEIYNDSFKNYNQILDKIINSIQIIEALNLSISSYWFNKANLFTLLIELNYIKKDTLEMNLLEFKLVDLEKKLDLYFNGTEDEIKTLTSDETKYFEASRQGSHELSAREHRAKVIKEIIRTSSINLSKVVSITNSIPEKNISMLNEKGIAFSILIPTATGLTKGIMDATLSVREFLKKNNIHDYSSQEFGPTNKLKIEGHFILSDLSEKKTEISLYRSNGRGDFRIWFTDLKEFVNANDELALIVRDDILTIYNITKNDYSAFLNE